MSRAVYTVCIGERKPSCEGSMEIIKAEKSEVIDCPCVLTSSQVIFCVEVFSCASVFWCIQGLWHEAARKWGWGSKLCEQSGWRGHNSVWSVLSSTNFRSSQKTRKFAGSAVVTQLWLVYYNEIRVIATGLPVKGSTLLLLLSVGCSVALCMAVLWKLNVAVVAWCNPIAEVMTFELIIPIKIYC